MMVTVFERGPLPGNPPSKKLADNQVPRIWSQLDILDKICQPVRMSSAR